MQGGSKLVAFLERRWYIVLALAVSALLFALGTYMIVEAFGFNEEALYWEGIATQATSKGWPWLTREEYLIKANGYRTMAAQDSAIGAASFAAASLIIGWTALFRRN